MPSATPTPRIALPAAAYEAIGAACLAPRLGEGWLIHALETIESSGDS